jgi:type II secretion system protein H
MGSAAGGSSGGYRLFRLPAVNPAVPRAYRLRRGFTLLELMVVVVIGGVIGAAALVKSGSIITQNKIQRAAQRLQTDVQQAYAIAARIRQPVILRWSSSSLEMQVTNRAQTTIYRRTPLGASSGMNLASSEITVYPTTLTVFPNGLAADTFFVRLSKSGFSRTVRVSRAGMVRLQ